LVFSDTLVETAEGKKIAQISNLVRGGSGQASGEDVMARGDDGSADPGEMGPFIGMLPFAAARQLSVEHMAGSRSRIVMPMGDANGDLDGGMHEGALLALLDTTGAMASWAATGPGRFKASTAALQAQITGPPPAGGLIGYGWVVQRSGDLFWSDVEIADAESGRLCARGTVVYRIVT
jgi:acyl-coenzyme A thioesterase PaaI-like protein